MFFSKRKDLSCESSGEMEQRAIPSRGARGHVRLCWPGPEPEIIRPDLPPSHPPSPSPLLLLSSLSAFRGPTLNQAGTLPWGCHKWLCRLPNAGLDYAIVVPFEVHNTRPAQPSEVAQLKIHPDSELTSCCPTQSQQVVPEVVSAALPPWTHPGACRKEALEKQPTPSPRPS